MIIPKNSRNTSGLKAGCREAGVNNGSSIQNPKSKIQNSILVFPLQ
jgi:hypothetical protein